jgi:hypothetical protein
MSSSKRKLAHGTEQKIDASWDRLGYPCLTGQQREELLSQLRALVALAPLSNLTRFLAIGTNSVMKDLRNDACVVVCVCKEAPAQLSNGIAEAAHIRGVPLAVLSHAANKLADALMVKRVSCLALRKHTHQSASEGNDMQAEALFDRITESTVQAVQCAREQQRTAQETQKYTNKRSRHAHSAPLKQRRLTR